MRIDETLTSRATNDGARGVFSQPFSTGYGGITRTVHVRLLRDAGSAQLYNALALQALANLVAAFHFWCCR